MEIKINLRNFTSSKTSIKRVKSRMQFELFRAKEVKSKAQSEQTTFERQENKTESLTIKNSKIMVKKNEKESPRALNEEELESVNGGGGGGGNRKRKKKES